MGRLFEGETIDEAQEWLAEHFESGETCPCCDQFVKLYKRKLDAGMARALIITHNENIANPDTVWFPVNDLLKKRKISTGASTISMLKHWGLLYPKSDAPPKEGAKSAGLYCITELGTLFALDQVSVKKHIYIYNKTLFSPEEASKEFITIREALGDKYDYSEMMNGRSYL